MQVLCAQCAGAIPLERDDAFLTCPFCGSTLFLDRAATFVRLELAATVGEARARDLLAQALRSREIPPVVVRGVEAKRLPFWAERGAEATTTQPAFAPLPVAIAGFRIPATGMTVAPEVESGPFEALECAGTATTRWEESGAPAGIALFAVPFYRITFGIPGGRECEAWIEAATGQTYLGELPPAETAAISRRSMQALCIVFAVVALESVVVPNPIVSLILAAAVVGIAAPLLRRRLGRAEAP